VEIHKDNNAEEFINADPTEVKIRDTLSEKRKTKGP